MVITPSFNQLYISNIDFIFRRDPIQITRAEVEYHDDQSGELNIEIKCNSQSLEFLGNLLFDDENRSLMLKPDNDRNAVCYNEAHVRSIDFVTVAEDHFILRTKWTFASYDIAIFAPYELQNAFNDIITEFSRLAGFVANAFEQTQRYKKKKEEVKLDWRQFGF